MNKPYTFGYVPKVTKKARERMNFSRKHPPMRCAACRAEGTLRKLDDKYLCGKCYKAAVAGRAKYNINGQK